MLKKQLEARIEELNGVNYNNQRESSQEIEKLKINISGRNKTIKHLEEEMHLLRKERANFEGEVRGLRYPIGTEVPKEKIPGETPYAQWN